MALKTPREQLNVQLCLLQAFDGRCKLTQERMSERVKSALLLPTTYDYLNSLPKYKD